MERFGKYTLLERVTTGGMAEVWRGVVSGHGGFRRIVAIKKILPCYSQSPEFQRMFVDEATIASHLSHANIAQIYDFDVVDGTPYIAMEFVEGKDLRSILERCVATGTRLPYSIAVFIALEIAKALYYVHSRRESSRPLNIIHRDVSPQNIMVSHAGEVKLVDFGIANAVSKQCLTQAGTVKGKYAYMSPEQVAGKPLDHRTDIFSLGVVLWEMMTLRRLFAGKHEAETISNVLRCKAEPPHKINAEVPEVLSAPVLKALSRERHDRYPTMVALYEDLSKILFDTGSYPPLERVASFVYDLFPDEMERLRQGEHLAFEPPDVSEPAAAGSMPPAAAARAAAAADPGTVRFRPRRADRSSPAGSDPASEPVTEDTADRSGTSPLGAVLEPGSRSRKRHWAAGLAAVVGIAAVLFLGYSYMERLPGFGSGPGGRSPDAAAGSREAAEAVARVPAPATAGPRGSADSAKPERAAADRGTAAAEARRGAETVPAEARERHDAGGPDAAAGDGKAVAAETKEPDRVGGPDAAAGVGKSVALETKGDGKFVAAETKGDGKFVAAETKGDAKAEAAETKEPDRVGEPDAAAGDGKSVALETKGDGKSVALETKGDEKAVAADTKDRASTPAGESGGPGVSGLEREQAVMALVVEPEKALVELDGRAINLHPKGVYGLTGKQGDVVAVKVSLEGYSTYEDTYLLKDAFGARKKVNKMRVKLSPVSVRTKAALSPGRENIAKLEVNAHPYAEVWENGKLVGPTPYQDTRPLGTYQFELRYLDQVRLCTLTLELGKRARCIEEFGEKPVEGAEADKGSEETDTGKGAVK